MSKRNSPIYEFLRDKEIHWMKNDGPALVFVDMVDIDKLTELLDYNYFSDGNVNVVLRHDGIVIDFNPVFEYFDVDRNTMKQILKGEDW